ncbi:hypothetical protein [Rubrivivax albus]|uniref:Uncharacterized protein n=1 Tax=Rubrivivax albus TaxID=2499835 RepID=A0A437JY71_9BURK|nr:hypothetical protein [Rubrivivax albus]RVT52623.1 hypothetical protein ENE75_09355 [Rubrivivax albus]
MPLLSCLIRSRAMPDRLAVRLRQPDRTEVAASTDERPRGCGWFDSSHDLHHGLQVTEHRDVDAVVNQIPLSWWLGWELDAVRTPVR